MSKEYQHDTTERSTSKAFYQLWVILMLLFCLGIILDGCEPEPETRTIQHIWHGKGWVDSLNVTSFDEHCTNQN